MALEATDLFVVQRTTGTTPLLKTTASQLNAFFAQDLDEVTTAGNTTTNSISVGKVGINISGIPAYELEVEGTGYFANNTTADKIIFEDTANNLTTGFSYLNGVLEQTGIDTTTTKFNSDLELASGKKFKGDGSELTNLPIGDGTITFSASQNLTVSGSFTTNQSGNTEITFTGPNLTTYLQKPGSEGDFIISEAANGTITYSETIDCGEYAV